MVLPLVLILVATVERSLAAASTEDWERLSVALNGRLHSALPLSSPCFPIVNGLNNTVNDTACAAVQAGYSSPTFRSPRFSAFMQPQWETCQSTEEKCLLDASNPKNSAAWTDNNCQQGNIPQYYIDIQTPGDVQKAFKFSAETGVPVSIKNSGHDYKGRSSLKRSLGLWACAVLRECFELSYSDAFVPEGGNVPYKRAIIVGAGVTFESLYAFANKNNVTVVGAYHQTVGPSGGWVMGGGHSVLSPVYGLGVDRVLQFKVVTPDGVYRTANAYENSDLFWALRGGGGSTFGVVLESTMLAEPAMKLQVVSISFNGTSETAPEFLKLIVEHSYRWGTEGWGGHMTPSGIINVTPLLTLEEATKSVQPITDYALAHNGTVVVEELPSWQAFFSKYVLAAEGAVGNEILLASRLIPSSLFTTEEGQAKVTKLLVDMVQQYSSSPYIRLGTPFLYQGAAHATSVTPAWRNSLWHVSGHSNFTYSSTVATIEEQYEIANSIGQLMRDVAPDSGAYVNEANVHEPNHEVSFWGSNYPALVAIKQKYDPHSLLDCWQCVGWKGPNDARYSCYL
ncbi:FAD-binding domain-containing protein [Hymenopellis radicata]|nr:FAD-binding domain-containing protein [Hymenopellis radicata]